MKTPLQELIDEMTYMLTEGERSIYELREKARKLLEKEKDAMCEFADDYQRNCFQKSADDYFEKTFKTKEK